MRGMCCERLQGGSDSAIAQNCLNPFYLKRFETVVTFLFLRGETVGT